jgi:hypothetical protein
MAGGMEPLCGTGRGELDSVKEPVGVGGRGDRPNANDRTVPTTMIPCHLHTFGGFRVMETTAGAVLRVSLVGCMVVAGACLVLGLYPAHTSAQPGPKGDKSVEGSVMRLNHIDLVVPNVKENRAFFEKYSGSAASWTVRTSSPS